MSDRRIDHLRARLDDAVLAFCGGSFTDPRFRDLAPAAERMQRRLCAAGLAAEAGPPEDEEQSLWAEAGEHALAFSCLGPFFCVLTDEGEPVERPPSGSEAVEAHRRALGRPTFVPGSLLRRPSPLCDGAWRPCSYFSVLFHWTDELDSWWTAPTSNSVH